MMRSIGVTPSHSKNNAFASSYHDEKLFQAIFGKRIFIGEKSDRICRFCRRNSTSTKFRNDAHLIPEFMGNKSLFCYFECDECNAIFSQYETAFSNFFNIDHTIGRVSGKNGVPNFRYNKKNPEISFKNSILDIRDDNTGSVEFNRDAGQIVFNVSRPAYIPQHVVKCLVKIGFCMLDSEDLVNYDLTRRWLINEIDPNQFCSHPFLRIFYRIGGGLQTDNPFVVRLKRKNDQMVPECTVLIAYSHFKFQIFMPFNINDLELMDEGKINFPIENSLVNLIQDKNIARIQNKDFSSLTKVVGEKYKFSMGVDFSGEK